MQIQAQDIRSLVGEDASPYLIDKSKLGSQNEFYRASDPKQLIVVIGNKAALAPIGNHRYNLSRDYSYFHSES